MVQGLDFEYYVLIQKIENRFSCPSKSYILCSSPGLQDRNDPVSMRVCTNIMQSRETLHIQCDTSVAMQAAGATKVGYIGVYSEPL